ncbi:MAG: hypothetical protein RLZZ210_1723, partial [Pseudomonadota bacterium]
MTGISLFAKYNNYKTYFRVPN